MIIECPNCNKKFNVNPELITDNGREIQCGSCNHVWFYQREKKNIETPSLEDNIVIEKDKPDIIDDSNDINIKENQTKINQQDKKITNRSKTKNKKTEKNIISKFFSYLIVLIISFIALIILLDTFKTPLYSVFPYLETILFSLFETLQDIKLFIIDLS